MTHIPTVVVHLTEGGIIEAVCADAEVRVILVDYMVEDGENVAPDGDRANIWAERMRPNENVTAAEYARAAGLPEVAQASGGG